LGDFGLSVFSDNDALRENDYRLVDEDYARPHVTFIKDGKTCQDWV
jgi:hypothetical protein